MASAAAAVLVKDLGFTLLSAGTDPIADVFFIHGLQGHPRATWTYPAELSRSSLSSLNGGSSRWRSSLKRRLGAAFRNQDQGLNAESNSQTVSSQQVFWPQDLLPESFPNLRVFTYGYDSYVTHWFKGPAMQLDILDYGESLLTGLVARRRENPERPIIFVVHSLGGLVLKDALRRSRSSSDVRLRSIHQATKAIIFFGTPHHGGNYVGLGLTARKILVYSGFDANDRILRDLKFDSGISKMLSEEFVKFLDEKRPLVFTFQEASGLSGFGPLSGKVVDDVSSNIEYSLQWKDHIYANHMDMCRFSGMDDDGYEKVQDALSHILSHDSQTGPQEQGVYQRLLASLFLPDLEERFNQVEDAYRGTFEWLFTKPEIGFADWLQHGNGIFWISGKPASGKSTLLKYAVTNPRTYDLLRQNNTRNRWITADFFFSNRGKTKQKAIDGLLQRILFQLLSQSKELVHAVEKLFLLRAEKQGWLLTYLEIALRDIVRQRKHPINICLFIDALDEHSEDYYLNHAHLVDYLQELSREADGNTVKILLCLTSRPESIFQAKFQISPGFPIHEHTHADVNTYVYSRMNEYVSARPDLSADGAVMASLNNIYKEIIRRAQGVFLWVKLVVTGIIEGLIDGDTTEVLRVNLSAIPGDGDLQELYRGILIRLRPHYLIEAFMMLWIAYATTEPLPLGEFFQVVGYTRSWQGDYDWKIPSVPDMERKLLSRCRGFLEIQYSFTKDELGNEIHGPFVQFLHQSVKDFLQKSQSFEEIKERLIMHLPEFSGPLAENGHAFLVRFRVQQHLQKYWEDPELLKQPGRFNLRRFDVFYQAHRVESTLRKPICEPLDWLADFADRNNLVPYYMSHEGWSPPRSWQPSFLALAVQAGLGLYLEYALQKQVTSFSRMPSARPLLHYAVFPMPGTLAGRRTDPFFLVPKMVELLVQFGANIHQEFEGLTAFAHGFEEFCKQGPLARNQLKMLEALVRNGASLDVPLNFITQLPPSHRGSSLGLVMTGTTRRPFPLQLAIYKDDLDAVDFLLNHQADLQTLTDDDWSFLRIGYLYGDHPPDFRRYQDVQDGLTTAHQKELKWWAEREEAIRRGKNKKPMLRLVESHMSRRHQHPRYNNNYNYNYTNISTNVPHISCPLQGSYQRPSQEDVIENGRLTGLGRPVSSMAAANPIVETKTTYANRYLYSPSGSNISMSRYECSNPPYPI